jgi:hypothetical protein
LPHFPLSLSINLKTTAIEYKVREIARKII